MKIVFVFLAFAAFASAGDMMGEMDPAKMDAFLMRLMTVMGKIKMMAQMHEEANHKDIGLCPMVQGKMCVGCETPLGMKVHAAMVKMGMIPEGDKGDMDPAAHMRDMMAGPTEECLEEFKKHLHMKKMLLSELGWINENCEVQRDVVEADLKGTMMGQAGCPMVTGADSKCSMAFKMTQDCIRKMEGRDSEDEDCPMLLKAAQNLGYFMCIKNEFEKSCMVKANLVLGATEFCPKTGCPMSVCPKTFMELVMMMKNKHMM